VVALLGIRVWRLDYEENARRVLTNPTSALLRLVALANAFAYTLEIAASGAYFFGRGCSGVICDA
jgi:hypothetical protein